MTTEEQSKRAWRELADEWLEAIEEIKGNSELLQH